MRKRNNFIERSLLKVLSCVRELLYAEEYAAQAGFLQSLDPRIKVASILSLVIVVVLLKNSVVIVMLYGICLFLAYLSRISFGFFLLRTWLFIPLFSLCIVIPSLFNIFTPGDPWFAATIFGMPFVITYQGIMGALLFVVRVTTSLSFVILLSLTTRHTTVLAVLHYFKIPSIFIITLGMCYRYVYLFIEMVENAYQALKSRVGTYLSSQRGQHIVTMRMAVIWHKSVEMSEHVYQAMLSRGYNGVPRIYTEFKTTFKDWLWFLSVVLVCSGALYCGS
jgi:cobalt/nickel transport system permease protein